MMTEHTPEPQFTEDGRILILGGSSYVGRHLFARLGPERAIATYNRHPIPDGVHYDALSMSLPDILERPETISHAVILLGDTNPETCAEDPERSQFLNVESIKRAIDGLLQLQIKPVFTSSEFVFDGMKGNYTETDPADPILLYGRQKVEVEQYLEEVCGDYIVARLAKVFGAERGDRTLFTGWLDAIERGQRTIRCAEDQVFSPIYVGDVVEGLIRLMEAGAQGVFHLSSREPFSRLALLEMLLADVQKVSPVQVEVTPCSIHDFGLREKRPLDVSMIPDTLMAVTGFEVSGVESVCGEIVECVFRNV